VVRRRECGVNWSGVGDGADRWCHRPHSFFLLTAFEPINPLDRSVNPIGSVSAGWSSAIADRYGLTLTSGWADWFDGIAGETLSAGEFGDSVHPAVLLEAAPEVIWPGLMQPDLLPLVGNGMGDYLCGRVGPDNGLSEVVHWYHGGGDCLPFGKTLAEAILYDGLNGRFPGRSRGLAVPAESPRGGVRENLESRRCVRWALAHLPTGIDEVFDRDRSAAAVADLLVGEGIAEVAVRCDLMLAALDNPIRRRMTQSLAADCNAHWERDVARWMFDAELVPAATRRFLASRWGIAEGEWPAQDWETAAGHAERIAAKRGDLAWVHDVLGWHAQRQGGLEAAIGQYVLGGLASSFTDQSVRFRTHFDSDRIGKFSVARLIELGAADRLDPDYVRRLRVDSKVEPKAGGWRDRVSDYWLERAARLGAVPSADSGDSAADAAEWMGTRYDLIYRAGWDVGCDGIQRYRDLLGKLAEAAAATGQTARATLARTHQACLESRYFLD